MISISSQSIGVVALESIQQNPSARVYGVTSKGIFLKMADSSIVFISGDSFRNPLIINLPGAGQFLETVNHADPVENSGGSLFFRSVGLQLKVDPLALWSARTNETALERLPPPPALGQFITRLRSRMQNNNEYFETVLASIGLGNSAPSGELQTAIVALSLPDLANLESLRSAGHFFAGRGRGLTPSGDDVLLGWCYALERLSHFHHLDLTAIHPLMTGLVSQRSTLISAGLITAATRREVDERLLYAFEAMNSVIPVNAAILDGVIHWGNSSGIEAVAGMALAVHAVYRLNDLPFAITG